MNQTQESTQAPGGHGMPLMLRFDPGVGLWTILTFVILLLLLKKVAWKPILNSLEARDKAVQSSLDQAARIQTENARLAEEQQRILVEAKNQAHQVLQTARESAETLKKIFEASAHEEKKRILASAAQEIEASKQAAIADLRKTTAELSIAVAEKLVRQNLDDAKNRALVDQLLQEVRREA